MDIITYALSKKIAAHALSGVQSMSVNGQTLIINTKDSGVLTMAFPTPKDGVSVADIDVNANKQIVFIMSDGTEFISGKIPTVKGDKGDPGFSPIITENADNTDKIYKLDITTADSTFTTPNLKGADGQGGTGGSGEENIIDSISVNGENIPPDKNKNVDIEVPNIYVGNTEPIDDSIEVWINPSGESSSIEVPIEKIKVNGELQTPVNKVVDITVPDAYDDTDIRAELANKADTDHTHTTVNGHTVESDVPVDAKFTDTVYDDTQIKTQIQAVANGLMDSVGYSADYKTIDIIAKNGVKKSVNVAPIISHASITELSDVDTTNKATGKALVYNATTSKHEYADVSGTDEKVKMDASTDAKYLGELLDNVTIANENGELKVKKLDGQEVTITEINYLKGLTMNVMDLVNMFSNGGVKIINTPVATYAELLTIDKSSFIDGISYLVYVLADENHDNAKTTYLVDKVSETPTYFGFADSQRDFTTNPIDLATEITGKLGIANMDSDAIKALFTVDNTYKTETATNNAFSTHGAKALYDELLLAIGNKANSSDLTAHKDDADIHVSTEDRTKWNSAKTHADSAHAPSNAQENVIETVKVNGTALEVSNKAVNVTVPTTVAELTDNANYAKKTDIPTTLPANGGNADTVNNHTVETNVPADAVFTDTIYDDTEVKESIEKVNSNLDILEFGEVAGGKNLANVDNISNIFKFKVSRNRTYVVSANGANTYRVLGFKNGEHTKNILLDIDLINDCIIEPSSLDIDEIYIDFTNKVIGFLDDKLFLRYYEDKDAQYEPYIPSVKMLAEENEQQNTEAMDLKMLGWTVPSECPIQNYVDNDGVFHQRVGRIDLGSLNWNYISSGKFFYADLAGGKIGSENAYCRKYNLSNATAYGGMANKEFRLSLSSETVSRVYVKDTSYTDATTLKQATKGVYLYYELETPITKTIDGNEVTERINESLSVIGKCKNLLNPTLPTTTQNGVTCTNNGDGTYTLNGTASASCYFTIKTNISLASGKYKLVGCPKNGGWAKYGLFYGTQSINNGDYGNGLLFDYVLGSEVSFVIWGGITVSNLVVKPMIVSNLNATYDDFVPYTGDGETLTHDVAKLNKSLADLGKRRINVLEHGIVGDGVTDNYDAIQNLINSADEGSTIFFPKGVYCISKGLVTSSKNINIVGERKGRYIANNDTPSAKFGSIIKYIGTEDATMLTQGASDWYLTMSNITFYSDSCKFKDNGLADGTIPYLQYALELSDKVVNGIECTHGCQLRNVAVVGMSGYGIKPSQAQNIIECNIYSCRYGILQENNDLIIRNCYISASGTAIYCKGSKNLIASDCYMDLLTEYGIYCENYLSGNITDCYIDHSNYSAVCVKGASNNLNLDIYCGRNGIYYSGSAEEDIKNSTATTELSNMAMATAVCFNLMIESNIKIHAVKRPNDDAGTSSKKTPVFTLYIQQIKSGYIEGTQINEYIRQKANTVRPVIVNANGTIKSIYKSNEYTKVGVVKKTYTPQNTHMASQIGDMWIYGNKVYIATNITDAETTWTPITA